MPLPTRREVLKAAASAAAAGVLGHASTDAVSAGVLAAGVLGHASTADVLGHAPTDAVSAQAASKSQQHELSARFPLRATRGERYLTDATGRPFLLHGDTAWSLAVQLTRPQILQYLSERRRQGFTAIMFEAVEHHFSSRTPRWRNAEGALPFASHGQFHRPLEPYWSLVDFIVSEANRRGMVCIVHPAYLGYGGGEQGWTAEVLDASPEELHSYGDWLARRYRNRGVIWCMGGDYDGAKHPGLIERQWNIAAGLLSIDPEAIVTAHAARRQSAYSVWRAFGGLSLNNIYTDGIEYAYAAAEYARPEALPFFLIEGRYDGDGATPADCRRQAYVTLLSGGCGHVFGNTPVWGFGEPAANSGAGPSAVLARHLRTTATLQMKAVRNLFEPLRWWTLQPRTDRSLVTSDLGDGKDRICPALAQDGGLALIWTSGGRFTVNLSALRGRTVRARWYDAATGRFAAISGLLSNAGEHPFRAPSERVLVLES